MNAEANGEALAENSDEDKEQDPDVEIENSGNSIFEIPNFCYIQVIVFDLSFLAVAAVGTQQVRYHEKNVKNSFRISKMRFPDFQFRRRDPNVILKCPIFKIRWRGREFRGKIT